MFWVVLVGSERQLCVKTSVWGHAERTEALMLLKYLEHFAPASEES